MYEYAAHVTAVHDGDTLTVDLDLGFSIWRSGLKIRLLGINAPELGSVKVPGPGGEEATLALMGFLDAKYGPRERGYFGGFGDYVTVNRPPVVIQTVLDSQEKYGRTLGTVWVAGRVLSVNDAMLGGGYAVPMPM